MELIVSCYQPHVERGDIHCYVLFKSILLNSFLQSSVSEYMIRIGSWIHPLLSMGTSSSHSQGVLRRTSSGHALTVARKREISAKRCLNSVTPCGGEASASPTCMCPRNVGQQVNAPLCARCAKENMVHAVSAEAYPAALRPQTTTSGRTLCRACIGLNEMACWEAANADAQVGTCPRIMQHTQFRA
jgi:hypothetical protein